MERRRVHQNQDILRTRGCQVMAGRYRPTFRNDELINYLKLHLQQSCTALAKHFNVSRQAMHHRLKKLEKRGWVYRKHGAGRKPDRWTANFLQPWRKSVKDKF